MIPLYVVNASRIGRCLPVIMSSFNAFGFFALAAGVVFPLSFLAQLTHLMAVWCCAS
jgi:hypothetical protein